MIKHVQHYTVAEIFSVNNNKVYRIPKYQREYTWGINEWDALFKDVTENEPGYFLGSYICVNSSSLNGSILEVIDGQQRFTSIMLLLTALYEKLSPFQENMSDGEKTIFSILHRTIANYTLTYTSNGDIKEEYTQRLMLQKQNMNDEDFSYILFKKGIITRQVACPSYFGNRRISKAYNHFLDLIADEITIQSSAKPNISEKGILFGIITKFQNAIMVGIEVDTNKDAYMLFESLNHRGVPLSALDLIKNTLIAAADVKSDADNVYAIWKQILTNIGDDYSVQERFFRQYYNSFREELNAPYHDSDKKYHLGYLATRTTLLDIYEEMIKSDYKSLIDDLLQKSCVYAKVTNNSDLEFVYSPALADLERVAGAPSYILLLYIISYQTQLALTDEHLNEIIKSLITFFVRRNVTDVPNTRKLTQLFIDIIGDAKSLQGASVVDVVRERLISVSAPDNFFETKLRGPIYDENPEATRFILCSIEAQHQTREIYSDLWKRDKNNKYVWTIEHIFPEGENIPSVWVDMIAGGKIELAKQYHSEYVHTLGNLTITGYNQHLSNMSFEQKKNRKSKDKKDIGYRNGLYLNQTVVNEDTWTIEKIQDRTNMLVRILKEMYRW